MICLTQMRTNKFITYEFARSASTVVVILRSKNNSLVEFSISIACQEKKGTIPGFTRIRKCKDFKNGLKQWNAGRRDSTLFGVVDETTTTKFTGRACAGRCNLLPVVVDKVVVVVPKFPIIVLWTTLSRSTMSYLRISQTNQSAAGNNKKNNCRKKKIYKKNENYLYA